MWSVAKGTGGLLVLLLSGLSAFVARAVSPGGEEIPMTYIQVIGNFNPALTTANAREGRDPPIQRRRKRPSFNLPAGPHRPVPSSPRSLPAPR